MCLVKVGMCNIDMFVIPHRCMDTIVAFAYLLLTDIYCANVLCCCLQLYCCNKCGHRFNRQCSVNKVSAVIIYYDGCK